MGEAALSSLHITEGIEVMSRYVWNTGEAQHFFCSICGIYTHHIMRGQPDRVGINIACLEGIDVYAVGEVAVGGGKRLSLVEPAARR